MKKQSEIKVVEAELEKLRSEIVQNEAELSVLEHQLLHISKQVREAEHSLGLAVSYGGNTSSETIVRDARVQELKELRSDVSGKVNELRVGLGGKRKRVDDLERDLERLEVFEGEVKVRAALVELLPLVREAFEKNEAYAKLRKSYKRAPRRWSWALTSFEPFRVKSWMSEVEHFLKSPKGE